MRAEVISTFLARQFSLEPSPKQKGFDVIFGIAAPIICLIFDPIVFKSEILDGGGGLSEFQLFAYISIGLGIATLSIWLFSKVKINFLICLISGIFLAGALLSFALGVYLLPVSLIGLLLGIGIFGFTPFLTAFVFLRNGIQVIRKIQPGTNKTIAIGIMLFGIVTVIGAPLWIQMKTTEVISQAISTIVHSEKDDEINMAIDKLQTTWCLAYCKKQFVDEYLKEQKQDKRDLLSEVYMKITGESIWNQLPYEPITN